MVQKVFNWNTIDFWNGVGGVMIGPLYVIS